MTPAEVLERFSEEEMVRVLAYQNLYGPVTPVRTDFLFARLGMDVATPHLRKGQKAKMQDHMMVWNPKTRPRKTPQEMLTMVREFQRGFERDG